MKLIDLIFPKQCLGCLRWGKYICDACTKSLTTTFIQRCIVCQKPSLYGYTHPKCKTAFTPDRLITIFKYSDPLVAKLINTAKLGLIPSLFVELGTASTKFLEVQSIIFHKFTICSIPSRRNKTLYRGFNQSLILSKVISQYLSLPTDNFLHKTKSTRQQKSLNKNSRLLNLHSSFTIKLKESLPKYVLLVDDVTTSGATFLETSKAIKRAGVSTVWCLAIAQD